MGVKTLGDYGNDLKDLDGADLEHTKGNSLYDIVGGKGLAPSMPQAVQSKLKADVYDIQILNRVLCFVRHNIETDQLIRADKGPAIEVIREIDRFWKLGADFKKFGFVPKRGFLLYGPPGTGKTSTLNQIMIDTVAADGVVVLAPFGPPQALIGMLRGLREVEPDRHVVVVLEDLDGMLRFGESELLSLLDGEHSISNVVYIATTNYIKNLPARIVNRPSRFDRQIMIGPPDADMRRKYLAAKGLTGQQLDQYVEVSDKLSMAHLKELIISCAILGNPLETEVKRLKANVLGHESIMVEI